MKLSDKFPNYENFTQSNYLAIRQAFDREMKDKNYGREETLTAWQWFYAGWVGHIKGPRSMWDAALRGN